MQNDGSFDGVFVVGAGQTPYEKRTSKTVQRLIWEASDLALRSAGLEFRDVDGLGVTCFTLAPENVTTMAEHLGLQCRWLCHGMFGGASGISGMLHAARAIQAGDASVVVIVAADAFDVSSHMSMNRSAGQHDYMGLWGYGAANGVFALQTRLYMQQFGATREDFGRLCIAQRQNAMLNPNALLRTPLTMEDYLNARPIADPLRLYDCVLPCCGADAVVLTNETIASRLDAPKVALLGGGEIHNFPPNEPYALSAGWEKFQDRIWRQSRSAPEQMDFVQLYDDYPVMEFIQLEGMGFAERGRAAELIRNNDCTVRGTLPINTGGGQLSAGQCGASGGMIGVYEAVVQLRGEAGERQVPDARIGAVTGYGAVSYGRGLSASACVLGRA
ncbi:MAG TPA: thiolase family protein [Burkholderiaceae bacterium]|nr:thiolase family protein [Burkholderiaceae bacterium]